VTSKTITIRVTCEARNRSFTGGKARLNIEKEGVSRKLQTRYQRRRHIGGSNRLRKDQFHARKNEIEGGKIMRNAIILPNRRSFHVPLVKEGPPHKQKMRTIANRDDLPLWDAR